MKEREAEDDALLSSLGTRKGILRVKTKPMKNQRGYKRQTHTESLEEEITVG